MKSDDPILSNPHFADFIDAPQLINERERLPGPDGTPGKGMKLAEAIALAEHWWEARARFSMPDFGKDPHKQVIKSGVLMGLPWANLSKQEMLHVLAQWYAHVGVHQIVEGRDIAVSDPAAKMQDARAKTGKMFDVFEKAHDARHTPTSDAAETSAHAEGYREIENGGKILGINGQRLTKGETDGIEENNTGEQGESPKTGTA